MNVAKNRQTTYFKLFYATFVGNLSGCRNTLLEPYDCYEFESNAGFRSIDGTCNNLYIPLKGAKDTAVERLLGKFYTN